MAKKETDSIVVTPLHGPLRRRSLGFAADGIDVGSLVDEILAEGIVIVDGSPLLSLLALQPDFKDG